MRAAAPMHATTSHHARSASSTSNTARQTAIARPTATSNQPIPATRSLHQLTFLNSETPISLARLPFPGSTGIRWQRWTIQSSQLIAQLLAFVPSADRLLPKVLRGPICHLQATQDGTEYLWVFATASQPEKLDEALKQCATSPVAVFSQISNMPDESAQGLLGQLSASDAQSGSYLLADASSLQSYKGKEPEMSSANTAAHTQLLQALKAKAARMMTVPESRSTHPAARLRLNNSIVSTKARSLVGNNALSSVIDQQMDDYSVFTDLHVSSTESALFVRAYCSRLPALPLSAMVDKVALHPQRTLLLAPYGYKVHSTAVLNSSVLAKPLLAKLQTTFSSVSHSPVQVWAVCTMPNQNNAKRFLWPATHCLALHDNALDPVGITHQSIFHLQPATPLKELASFTLKVLQDANSRVDSPYAPGEDHDPSAPSPDQFAPPGNEAEATPVASGIDDLAWMHQIVGMDAVESAIPAPSASSQQTAVNDTQLQPPNASQPEAPFSNVDLLTEDDFSFFDSGAFGLQHPSQASFSQSAVRQLFGSQAHPAEAMPPSSTAASDFTMTDADQSSLDALFSTVPTDVIMAPVANNPSSMSISSLTPREVSGTIGDPASLPAFTPGSLTESSPTFGQHSLKTPRTPYSPHDSYRDNVTVLNNNDVPTPGALPNAAQQALHEHADAEQHKKSAEDGSKLRPTTIPQPFLPLAQRFKRPSHSIVDTRANVGHKYDPRGKFASRPKSHSANDVDRPVSSDQVRKPVQAASVDQRSSPSAVPRKGQALLQLRLRGRNLPSRPRRADTAYTPRSIEDPNAAAYDDISESDDSNSDNDASSDNSSDIDDTSALLNSAAQESMFASTLELVLPTASVQTADFTLPRRLEVRPTILRPTMKQWMLSKTAVWLTENPQFRSLYGDTPKAPKPNTVTIGEKVDVLDAMVSYLFLEDTPKLGSLTPAPLNLVTPDVLEPATIAVGCQASVLEALPSALGLWDKTNLSAVGGPKHVVAIVLLTQASTAWLDEISGWLDRMRSTFQTYELGTHEGDSGSILAVADELEAGLSTYLDKLIEDSDTWLDTLRSISSRVQTHLLQGKHVVLYTVQNTTSSSCHTTGYHGLLRFETDLKELLRDEIGALAEHMIVRPIIPSMITESGSLGFGQQPHSLRRLAFSVYDQLRRLVRRQSAKILHGREPGPLSAVVRFPAFTLSTRNAQKPRTSFALLPPETVAPSFDDKQYLHIGYTCSTINGKRLVTVSSIDEQASGYAVDAWLTADRDEAMVEHVWKFALNEASKANVKWCIVVTKSGLITQAEARVWHAYSQQYGKTISGQHGSIIYSLCLLSARTEDTGAVLAERGQQVRPAAEWTVQTSSSDKTGSVLLDVSDFSQNIRPTDPLPLTWTCHPDEFAIDVASSQASRLLIHTPRKIAASAANAILLAARREATSHVLAIDLVLFHDLHTSASTDRDQGRSEDVKAQVHKERLAAELDHLVTNLHQLRLISTERHQLPAPWAHLPWHVGVVLMLQSHLASVTVE